MNLTEQNLERLVQCPIMDPTPVKADVANSQLVGWALRQSFHGKITGTPESVLSELRGKFLTAGADGTAARRAGYRLFRLLIDYEIIHPEQPYSLIVSGYTIQGQYALLRSRKGERLPHVLLVHPRVPKQRATQSIPPDAVSLARLFHVRTSTEYTNARLLHYTLAKGKSWITRDLDVDLARKYIESILKIAALNPYFPIAGDHCQHCGTKPCLKVFHER